MEDVKLIKLEDLLEIIDIYQDLQLVNAKTGEILSPVTYIAEVTDEVTSHYRDIVHGISAGVTEEGNGYLKIMVDNVI